jgi:phage recombination protein Bet
MTEIIKSAKSDLTKMEFTGEQIELIKKQIAKGASDDELKMFIHVSASRGLDPFKRHIYCVMRPFYNQEKQKWDSKMSIEVSVDGFRLIAERSGKYAGRIGPFWCGEDGKWNDVWLSNSPPAAAKVGILRHDFKEPVWAVARFDAFAVRNKDGKLNPMWSKMGEHMLAKVAETQALRTAMPEHLGGLYGQEEMEQAGTLEEKNSKLTALKRNSIAIDPDKSFQALEERFKKTDTPAEKEPVTYVINDDQLPGNTPKEKITLEDPPEFIEQVPSHFINAFPYLKQFEGKNFKEMNSDSLSNIYKVIKNIESKVTTEAGKKWVNNTLQSIEITTDLVNNRDTGIIE